LILLVIESTVIVKELLQLTFSSKEESNDLPCR
jgi:hypothetical protein